MNNSREKGDTRGSLWDNLGILHALLTWTIKSGTLFSADQQGRRTQRKAQRGFGLVARRGGRQDERNGEVQVRNTTAVERPQSCARSRGLRVDVTNEPQVRLEQSVRDAGKATCPPGRKTGRARMESLRRLTPEQSISVDPWPTEGLAAQTTCRRGNGAFTLFRSRRSLPGIRLVGHAPLDGYAPLIGHAPSGPGVSGWS